jgi:hypothetical protein
MNALEKPAAYQTFVRRRDARSVMDNIGCTGRGDHYPTRCLKGVNCQHRHAMPRRS